MMPPTYGSCDPEPSLMSIAPENNDTMDSVTKQKDYCIPKRYVFSFICFTACCLAVSYNVNLSIAIVSMIEPERTNASHVVMSNFTGFISTQNLTQENFMRLQWDGKMVGSALGAVYYGQLVSFIPGGRMAELYGGKRMLIYCTLLAAVATALGPVTAFWNHYAFIASRVLVGIGTGPIIPIVFYMLARWIPSNERSFHASFILSGYGIGSFLAVMLSGAICSNFYVGGWPSVFYLGAFCGIVWALICAIFMSEAPELHPRICEKELLHIGKGRNLHQNEKIPNIPWTKMALSVPLWALAIGFFGQFWLLGFFSTVHALYMGTVLNLPVAKNGVLSCLPHLLRAFATCMASYPVDIMLKRRMVSVGFVRKAATIINSVVSCAAFLGITYVGRNVTATTILFIAAGILGEFVTFGVCMGCIDIAPNLSGTVSGILNIVGVFPFFIIPNLVGWITNYENSIEKWQRVFYVTVAVVGICTGIFTVFGDLRPQSWGFIPNTKKLNSEENNEKRGLET